MEVKVSKTTGFKVFEKINRNLIYPKVEKKIRRDFCEFKCKITRRFIRWLGERSNTKFQYVDLYKNKRTTISNTMIQSKRKDKSPLRVLCLCRNGRIYCLGVLKGNSSSLTWTDSFWRSSKRLFALST